MKYALMIALTAMLYACNNNEPKKEKEEETKAFDLGDDKRTETKYADDKKGIGKFKNVELAATLDQNMVANGTKTYEVKCSACHKLNNEKLVGPGWKGVTSRRKAEWVMNFVTNTDEMISKDP